jgi:hypothetical protein
MTFNPSGARLIFEGYDDTVRFWEPEPERVANHMCEVAYPQVTEAEWSRYVSDVQSTPPCP